MAAFEWFVDDAIEQTAAEFSVSRALRQGVRGPGGATVDRLLKNSDLLWDRVVQPELDSYREQTVAQFSVLVDAVESDDEIGAYRDEILDAGTFAEAIREDLPPERYRRVEDRLFAHHEQLGTAIAPLVETPESEFWDAARAQLTPDQARELIEEQFAFTAPLREHRDAFALATAVDPGELLGGLGGLLAPSTLEIEYTDEAIRAMRRAEQSVIVDAKRKLDRQFDGRE
jgi:hypothetical protein